MKKGDKSNIMRTYSKPEEVVPLVRTLYLGDSSNTYSSNFN